ncbi:copper resistance CopC family protein [Billgrantia saliphila]|uniref:copper resistance CopC family protein n=1 Tax=Billgrantia saliphila TaxID=1848458 RepID=UPI000CE4F0CB|nr:copper resistance CopC family protein [Halomonas saliphila]
MSGEPKGGWRQRLAPRVVATRLAMVWLLLASPLLLAHSHVVATQPADGEVLQQAPSSIAFELDAPLRLTRFALSGPQGEVPLTENPVGGMAKRHEGEPAQALPPGDYRVEWRGIAEDGHTMSGDYRFSIRE